MKKLILIVAMSMLFVSSVGASSINGDYNGNPIVIVKSQGKELKSKEVPALIYEGNTMVPISLLRQLGASVDWDENTYSVNVVLPQAAIQQDNLDIKKLQSDLINEVSSTSYTISALGDVSQLSLELKFDVSDPASLSKYQKVLNTVGYSTVRSMKLVDQSANGYIYIIKTINLKEFMELKITNDEFNKRIEIYTKQTNTQATTTQSNVSPSNITQRNTNQSNVVTPQSSQSPVIQSNLSLYSNDGKTYLGKLTTNEYDSDSIFNEFGTYGSKFNAKSIWNEFGDYGSKFSSKSAFNEFTTTPPMILSNGKVVGYLTTNSTITGAISPFGLKETLKKLGY